MSSRTVGTWDLLNPSLDEVSRGFFLQDGVVKPDSCGGGNIRRPRVAAPFVLPREFLPPVAVVGKWRRDTYLGFKARAKQQAGFLIRMQAAFCQGVGTHGVWEQHGIAREELVGNNG